MFKFLSTKVDVVFVDADSGTPFARSAVPPDQLPDSFDLETNLEIQGQSWFVVDAQPRHKSEFQKSRKLELKLRKVEQIDPSKLLFSLPSINDALPQTQQGDAGPNAFSLSEDDWRQVELISQTYGPEIDAELKAIAEIHDQHRAEVGWRKIHVRSRIPNPITAPGPSLTSVRAAFNVLHDYQTLEFSPSGSLIVGGWAFQLPELVLYGIQQGGMVTTAGVHFQSSFDERPLAPVLALARTLNCSVVHWCRCRKLD